MLWRVRALPTPSERVRHRKFEALWLDVCTSSLGNAPRGRGGGNRFRSSGSTRYVIHLRGATEYEKLEVAAPVLHVVDERVLCRRFLPNQSEYCQSISRIPSIYPEPRSQAGAGDTILARSRREGCDLDKPSERGRISSSCCNARKLRSGFASLDQKWNKGSPNMIGLVL